jgi:hypothetical protein
MRRGGEIGDRIEFRVLFSASHPGGKKGGESSPLLFSIPFCLAYTAG